MKRIKIQDKHRIGAAASLFLLSVFIIVGYYWVFDGQFGNFSLTFSKYAARSLWTTIVFSITNISIALILLDFVRVAKNYNTLLYIVMYAIVVGLFGMSLCPDGLFNVGNQIHWTAFAHNVFAGITFTAMIIASFIALKRNWKTLRRTIPTSIYIIYSLAFMLTFFFGLKYSVKYVLLWEVLFLLAFYIIADSIKTHDT
ncbi:hypothetical protein IKG02_02175 [Candidatus Saccharibacteria bacterium]|nr:hypothetical protein [Candidatus Saccharibacteria bacterium]